KLALPRRENPRDRFGDRRPRLEETVEPFTLDDEEGRIALGAYGGGPRLAGEERHLAEERRRIELGHPRLPARGREREHLDGAAAKHVERVAGLAFATDRFAAAELELVEVRHERGELRFRELVQEIDLAE